MNRLFEIAKELGSIANDRFNLRESIRDYENRIKRARVELAPAGGWPGTNEAARKIAQEYSELHDPDLMFMRAALDDDEVSLEKLESNREALIAERDAWQWTIRDEENVSRGQESVFVQMMRYEPEGLDEKEVNAEYENAMSEMREEASAPTVATHEDGTPLPF
jgi:hypothetical protein